MAYILIKTDKPLRYVAEPPKTDLARWRYTRERGQAARLSAYWARKFAAAHQGRNVMIERVEGE